MNRVCLKILFTGSTGSTLFSVAMRILGAPGVFHAGKRRGIIMHSRIIAGERERERENEFEIGRGRLSANFFLEDENARSDEQKRSNARSLGVLTCR